jgi:uroporphyrin-3 C-methyltransferase
VVTNIQSQLTLAEWAVVHRQADIYQQSLLQVDNWLQHYFSIDSPLVQSMLKTTDALKKVSVNPATPIISRSIDALAQLKLNP